MKRIAMVKRSVLDVFGLSEAALTVALICTDS